MERNLLECGPKISVIVPAYNVEKYLSCCLDSILSQSYSNLEIIIVNDGSTDGTGKIIQKYVDADSRVISVNHEKNRGLFQARLTGYEQSSGEYIAFVDSDDSISFDWYRLLLKKATCDNADIVVGEWCYSYEETKTKEYCTLDPFRVENWNLQGSNVLDAFMAQEGRSFSWSVVWNKLYSRTLWEDCYPILNQFSQEHGHMLMWEDVAFSSVLWTHAKHMTNVHGAYYYYNRGNISATVVFRNKKRLQKYLNDSYAAIELMKYQLERAGRYDDLEKHYVEWKHHWGGIVYRDICIQGQQKSLHSTIVKKFDIVPAMVDPRNLNYICSPLAETFEWYESIKKLIVDKTVEYISFDVFDTLVERPFMQPTDMFEFLSDCFNNQTASFVDFRHIRVTSEEICREELRRKNSGREEITLEEIYEQIEHDYGFDHQLLLDLMQYEIELEERFCTERAIGRELYDLAKEAGKRIIICSDMYLPQAAIENILRKNGYSGYEAIFVSSVYSKTKYSKNLYRVMMKVLGIKIPSTVVHIGDSWDSDFKNPQKIGMRSAHINKAVDIFRNLDENSYGGNLYQEAIVNSPDRADYNQCFIDFPAVRNIFALGANKAFGNPFVSYQKGTAFNGDPNLIGYEALGPHLLAVCNWLMKRAQEKGVGTIHFVARDGYLVKKSFDILNRTTIKSNYIRVSRKALILADVKAPTDLYSLFHKVDVYQATPMKLLGYINPIIPREKLENIENILREAGINPEYPINNQKSYLRTMEVFITKCIDMSLLPLYQKRLKDYFSSFIKPGDYIFDIGYSGRTESALSCILGFPVGSFYMHVNSDIAFKRQKAYNCPCECFYEYKPSITGVMREHLFMELAPSCIAYSWENDTIQPIFEEYESEYDSERMTRLLQDAAIQFVKDFNRVFDEYIPLLNYQYEVVSAPYEYYLHFSNIFDRQLFATLPFEDSANGNEFISALNFWNAEIENHHLTASRGGSNQYYDENNWFEGIYPNGLYVKFYRWLNKSFPRGSVMRERIKSIVRIFIH